MHVALSAANIPAATRRATPNLRLRDPVASRRVRAPLSKSSTSPPPGKRRRPRQMSLSSRACRVARPDDAHSFPRGHPFPRRPPPVPPSSAPRVASRCPPRPSTPTPPPCSSTSTALWVTPRLPPCASRSGSSRPTSPTLPPTTSRSPRAMLTSAITRVRRLSSWWTWWRRDRKAAGLPSVEETRASAAEDPAVLAHVNAAREESGLPPPSRTPARSGRTFSPCRRTRPWMRSPRSPIRARASPTCSRA